MGMEARVGIEPTHKGFADLSLTTWVPRPGKAACFFGDTDHSYRSQPDVRRRAEWSGRRDLNSRPSPWQGDALPLSYSRFLVVFHRSPLATSRTASAGKLFRARLSIPSGPPWVKLPNASLKPLFASCHIINFMLIASIAALFARAAAAAAAPAAY